MRFLGLGLEDPVPDATTVWQYREQLVQAGVVDELFGAFDAYLKDQGWLAMGGQMIDASIVPVPKQRNDRDENAAIKAGKTPEGWDNKPAKNRQKDTDARWTKKHGTSHYGYKNHVSGRPMDASDFPRVRCRHAVRCSRVFGLSVRPLHAAGLYGDARVGSKSSTRA
jgi:IS5 family transposase